MADHLSDGRFGPTRPHSASAAPDSLKSRMQRSAAVETSDAGRGIPALEPVPPVALVLCGVTSIQFGAALAATLFDDLGPAGTSLLRLAFAAIVLLAVWRPRPSRHPVRHLRLLVVFGLVLGLMNL